MKINDNNLSGTDQKIVDREDQQLKLMIKKIKNKIDDLLRSGDYDIINVLYNILIDKKYKLSENELNLIEAKYKNREVELNKPSRGDVKKYKVFVKNPDTGNIKKVNFGDKNMEIKRDDPERRKSFRARHKCDTAKDKTTPRYWSCKFWSSKNVSDLIKEVVEPHQVDISSIKFHDHLNPLIWDDNKKLKDDVRNKLLLIAKRFIEFSDLNDIKFHDIILTGSIANYNYHDDSDIDVHIVIDYSQISNNEEFVGDYLRMKKSLWNDKFDIQIKGHDVEMYYQDSNEPHVSTGTYSLMKNKWIVEPTKKIVDINTKNIQSKTSDLMNYIDELETVKNPKIFYQKYNKIKDKIKKMRQSGLRKEGEFSVENLAFKILRNSGYLEKMVEMKNDYLEKELSLSEKFN